MSYSVVRLFRRSWTYTHRLILYVLNRRYVDNSIAHYLCLKDTVFRPDEPIVLGVQSRSSHGSLSKVLALAAPGCGNQGFSSAPSYWDFGDHH